MKALNARHIVLLHYNNFFDDDYSSPSTLFSADVQEFLRCVQTAACGQTEDRDQTKARKSRLEKIHVPDVDALVLID